ncbi:MAG: hypothetical protein O6834_09800, partial [Actinobacteria bacterium]|nr:hypothetical protein [Actinomycetota bacterium]
VEATLDCTGGWYATEEWSGCSPPPAGRSFGVLVSCRIGHRIRPPVPDESDVSSLLMATHAGGEPLWGRSRRTDPTCCPGQRGFWRVIWVSEVVVNDRPAWWQPRFPLTQASPDGQRRSTTNEADCV